MLSITVYLQKNAPIMETNRQKKINKLLQKDLGEIFQRESPNLFQRAMITVTRVNVTPDLSIAKVYLSIFGSDAEIIIKQVKVHTSEIRKQLGMRIKNQLRQVPQLQFFVDDSLDYIENIEKLLKK
jgi:ribosome-binding factor A